MAKFASVEDYLAAQPAATRAVLEEIRGIVHATLPDAGEKISYDIPTFTVDDRSVVHVAGWAKHVSLYPVPGDEDLADELAPYVAGKGTLKLPLGQPLPRELVARVVTALAARS